MKSQNQASYKSYITGFVLSLALTITVYLAVVNVWFSGWGLISLILVLAVLQLMVQLIFFLHLGREAKPRWNLLAFLFMLMVLIIVVFGSLWIMKNLNYHSMSPHETDKYIQEEELIER